MNHYYLLLATSCISTYLIFHRSELFLVLVTLTGMAQGITMQEYFPEIGDDLSAVTWGHAVNSQQLFNEAIKENLMMLEADVVLGTLIGESGDLIPVMGHPPNNTSDLSLKAFLSQVMDLSQKGHRCGIKLDFKSLEVLEPSLDELHAYSKQINFPVMLNADILPGPLHSLTKPVEADSFLSLCVRLFPTSTLSVGWTTLYGGAITNASYSPQQVVDMIEALKRNQVTQPVTFPVRAGIAARSANPLTKLKDTVPNSTFTIWSSENDPVEVQLLRDLIVNILGRERTFVDVPKKLMDQLQLSEGATKTSSFTAPSAATTFSHTAMSVIASFIAVIMYWFK